MKEKKATKISMQTQFTLKTKWGKDVMKKKVIGQFS
jgi:hypothetical protein